MNTSVKELLASAAPQHIVGRERDLEQLSFCLEPEGALVTWVHGLPGIGKSQLIDLFEQRVLDLERLFYRFDCRLIEPTPLSVQSELEASGATQVDAPVIVFDNYESFRLVDSWIRRTLLPSFSANVRIVLVSREAPATGWISSPAWRKHFASQKVEPLDDAAVIEFLSASGIDGAAAARIARWSRGHPLAMTLAASSSGNDFLDARHADIGQRLAACFLGDTEDPAIRCGLEASAVVRRITRPVLEALCDAADSAELYDSLATLSFVEQTGDGLAVHDLVREAIARQLSSGDPERFRHLRSEAWRLHRDQLANASPGDLWRSTSDTIYLLANPVVREAFFPSAAADYTVEPAQPADFDAINAIIRRHEPVTTVTALDLWQKNLPEAFHVVRDSAGEVAGFCCVARPDEIDASWMTADPVAHEWIADLARARNSPRAILIRRWLDRETGEVPSPVQAAAWIDIKRTYLELRPALRRVYLCVHDLAPYAEVATELGFKVIEGAMLELDGRPLCTAMLDFGPGSVDGWINRLLAAELGIAEEQLLDHASHELLLDGKRLGLTPLEYGVLSLLEGRRGEAVARETIINEVWGRDYTGGSNVVDAVVRGLRKKCGDHEWIVETVRGVGYRMGARTPQFSSKSHE